MKEERFITFPPDSVFIDPDTKKRAKRFTKETDGDGKLLLDEDGKPLTEAVKDRDHEWFAHTFVLSHPVFALKVGGYDAVRCRKQIAKAIEKAIEEGQSYYGVGKDHLRMMQLTMATPSKKDSDKKLSAADQVVSMSNYEEGILYEQMDAIMDASTKRPEEPDPTEAQHESLLDDESAPQAEAAN